MSDFSYNPILKYPAVRSGLSMIASSLIFCGIGKYMKIEAASLSVQAKAFGIATAIQTAFLTCFSKSDEHHQPYVKRGVEQINYYLYSIITPLILIGMAVKNSKFKKHVLGTASIATGYFIFNRVLLRNIPIKVYSSDFEQRHRYIALSSRPIIRSRDLNLKGNLDITALPKKLCIIGTLNLEGCSNLTTMPEILKIESNFYNVYEHNFPVENKNSLNLKGCTSLTRLPRNLHIKKDLNLEGCTGLTSLPEGLIVEGDLNLKKCTNLRSLTEGLSVGGNINMLGCTSLTSLPEGLSVGGNLKAGVDRYDDATSCINLRSLPNNMTIRGNLDLEGCINLESLPENLRIGGELNLDGCTRIRAIPSTTHVGGDLSIARCTGITNLPENLDIPGSLHLCDCSNMEKLPLRMTVGGGLNLHSCTKLTSLHTNQYNGDLVLSNCTGILELPENLQVGGDFYLENNVFQSLPEGLQVQGELHVRNLNIKEFPEDLKELGGLELSQCQLIESLPEGLKVGDKGLSVAGCDRLNSLPNQMRVEGDVYIRNNIPELPDDLFIGGDLKYEGSRNKKGFSDDRPSLRKLSKGLHVGGDLFLHNSLIESLPEDLIVDGNFLLADSNLRRLPSWITKLGRCPKTNSQRTLQLYGTKISQSDINLLNQAYQGNPDISLSVPLFSSHEYSVNLVDTLESGKHLAILGISHLKNPTKQDVKTAFNKFASTNHPDKGGDSDTFIKGTEARDKLLKILDD